MKCIRNIQNLVIGKVIGLKEQNAFVINKPNSEETYIICPSYENPHSDQFIEINLGNVRSLYDGSFTECNDEYHYVVPQRKRDYINLVPFMIALKSQKKILPVYVSNGKKIVISYASPFEVKDCYTERGSFDYDKFDAYVKKWDNSIIEAKQESEKIKKLS